MMNWWRAHHGISNDIKLALIAAKLNIPRCEVGWIWIVCLDHASQNEDNRGNIGNLGSDEIAMLAGVPTERADQILRALRDRDMLQGDGRVTAWDKRQPKRERPDDDSSQRVQRLREAQRHVTPCNATDSHVTPRLDEIRVDKEEENNTTQRAPKPGALAIVKPSAKRPRKPHRTIEEIEQSLGSRSEWWGWFWKVYPCHEGKRDAMDAYERIVTTHEIAAEIYKAAQKYAARIAADPTAKVKWAQGWLNGQRWKDEIDARASPVPVRSRDLVANVAREIQESLIKGESPW
jgi:hypothetical protein